MDRAEQTYRILSRAARAGLPCPKNGELAERLGVTNSTASEWVTRLERAGRITVLRGLNNRVVTLTDTGESTAGEVSKEHWRLASPHKAARASERTRETRLTNENSLAELTRVDRDPCPLCGVRGDIGCSHSRAATRRLMFAHGLQKMGEIS